jgi:hypothetical protein
VRLVQCDQCGRQANVHEVTGDGDPWPQIITATEPIDPVFCGWRCLSLWSTARVLIDSAGGAL